MFRSISVSGAPTLSSRSGSPEPATDHIKNEIDELTENKHVMVFSGYSALEYRDTESLDTELRDVLHKAIGKVGVASLCVAAGATVDGIGRVYAIAHNLGIKTLGVVSGQAHVHGSISEDCDKVIYVPDPSASWQVRDETGRSYMTYLASPNKRLKRSGEFLAFGGGDVTLQELTEAKELGLKTTIYSEFEPNPEKAAARKEKSPNADLMPVRTAFGRDAQ